MLPTEAARSRTRRWLGRLARGTSRARAQQPAVPACNAMCTESSMRPNGPGIELPAARDLTVVAGRPPARVAYRCGRPAAGAPPRTPGRRPVSSNALLGRNYLFRSFGTLSTQEYDVGDQGSTGDAGCTRLATE